MTENIRIFIKTYPKDFFWLELLLRSIEKYVSGFCGITIVCDRGKRIPQKTLNYITKLPIQVIYLDLPLEKPKSTKPHLKGYIWQQFVKLNWWNYCNENYCMQVDSDCIFKEKFTPQDLLHNNKFIWNFTFWKYKQIERTKWKVSTDKILRKNIQHHGMVGRTFLLTRYHTRKLIEYITENKADFWSWQWMIDNDIGQLSEYCLYGGFIFDLIRHESENLYHHQIWKNIKDFHLSDIALKTTKHFSQDKNIKQKIEEFESYL